MMGILGGPCGGQLCHDDDVNVFPLRVHSSLRLQSLTSQGRAWYGHLADVFSHQTLKLAVVELSFICQTMPDRRFILYWCENDMGQQKGWCLYWGIAGVLPSQGVMSGLLARRRHMLKYPKRCLGSFDDINLHKWKEGLGLDDALVEEARETAKSYQSYGGRV